MIKKFVAPLALFFAAIMPLLAQAQTGMTPNDRQRWLQEIRTYKHDFLAKELELTRDQENQFFPLYDEMEDRIEQLNADTREIENRVTGDETVSDIEVRNAARAIFELKQSEGKIEMEYFEKFSDILSPRQLMQLKNAERKFTRQLINSHRRLGRGSTQEER